MKSDNIKLKSGRGLTFLETIISLAILGIVASVSSVYLFGYRSRQSLELDAEKISVVVRETRSRAVTQEDGEQWGIHFENPVGSPDFYEVFKGPSYASGTVVRRVNLSAGVRFTDPVEPGSRNVVFSKITGFPNAEISVKISPNVLLTTQERTVTVSVSGLVVYTTSTPATVNVAQIHYRWRSDNGSQSGANFAAAEDTLISGLTKNTLRRLRFEVSNEGTASSSPVSFLLEYATSASGPWTTVPAAATAEHWELAPSGNITDGEVTTNVSIDGGLTDENTNFVAGQIKDTTNQTNPITLTNDDFTEIEYSIRATNNAFDGQAYYFRLSNAGAPITTYAIYPRAVIFTPTITVGTTGSQIATTSPSQTDKYIGGAFTLSRDWGSADVTQIVVSQAEAGTVNANANLFNVDIRYETAASCSYGGTETLFGTAANFDSSEKATVSGSPISVGTSQICVYVILDIGAGVADGQTIEIEIFDPSTDVTALSGVVSPVSVVAIAGTTTVSAPPTLDVALDSSSGGNNASGGGSCGGTAAWEHALICVKVPAGTPTGSQPAKGRSSDFDSNTQGFNVP